MSLNIRDSILIKGVKYSIIAKLKFSNIDERSEVLRYLIRQEDNQEEPLWIEFDTGNGKYSILNEFVFSNLYNRDKLEETYRLEKKRLMVIDSIGLKQYNITSYVDYKKYFDKEKNKHIIVERNSDREKCLEGYYGNINDIALPRIKPKKIVKPAQKMNVVEPVIIESRSIKTMKLFIIAIVFIIAVLGIIYISGN